MLRMGPVYILDSAGSLVRQSAEHFLSREPRLPSFDKRSSSRERRARQCGKYTTTVGAGATTQVTNTLAFSLPLSLSLSPSLPLLQRASSFPSALLASE